jgi:hypothetical protein
MVLVSSIFAGTYVSILLATDTNIGGYMIGILLCSFFGFCYGGISTLVR